MRHKMTEEDNCDLFEQARQQTNIQKQLKTLFELALMLQRGETKEYENPFNGLDNQHLLAEWKLHKMVLFRNKLNKEQYKLFLDIQDMLPLEPVIEEEDEF